MSFKQFSCLILSTSLLMMAYGCGSTEPTDNAEAQQASEAGSTADTTDTSSETSEDTENSTETNSETDTSSDTDTETQTETETEVESDTDTETETETETDSGSDTEEVTPVDPSSFSCVDDDPYEDNDSFESAMVLESGVALEAISCSIDGEYNHDNDIYQIAVGAGCELKVDLTFVHAEGDLELMCYADEGDTIAGQSTTESDVESVTYVAEADETVYMSVFPYMSMGNRYSILATVTCQ